MPAKRSLTKRANAAEWLSTGLHGFKVGFGKRGDARLGFEHDRDVEYMRRVRDAIGPDKTIMLDMGVAVQWDVAEAVAFEVHADEGPGEGRIGPTSSGEPRRAHGPG